MLVELGIIDLDLLYIFYYAEIVENLTIKLSVLIKWCGTGLDFAADYTCFDLARTGVVLVKLMEKLNTVHQAHGADLVNEGISVFIENFKEKTKSFFSDPGEYCAGSPNSLDRIVGIKNQRRQAKPLNNRPEARPQT